jgi:hypothetical protein
MAAMTAPAAAPARVDLARLMGSISTEKQVPVARTSPAGVTTVNGPPDSTR